MSTSMPPVLSSSVKGPLGVAHLPRLWLKILLFSQGRLPDGYRHGTGGFDEFLTTTLGIDRDAFVAYVENEKPDYLTLERWVREHATNLTTDTIAKVNERVAAADMSEELLAERRARLGIDQSITKAVAVNDIDDWNAMHAALLSP